MINLNEHIKAKSADDIVLDPVTFEVLKNSYINSVNQMSEQILRTCYSFVIYNRDFSNGLSDANGNSIAQGEEDLAGHIGTLHLTCKAVIEAFKGRMEEGDVYIINDPYLGGTHFSDVRLVRPIFVDGEVIAFSQANGHWTDVGGSSPGSFDVHAKDMFSEGVRIPPTRLWHAGRFCDDVANLIAAQTRDPAEVLGDMHSQAEATRVCEREIHRLVGKYGKDVVVKGFSAVQDYVETATVQRLGKLPQGTWEAVDYMDRDLGTGQEGLIPIKIKLTLTGDKIIYDLTGSHPCVQSIYNAGLGGTFSACVAATKYFFPDLPLNSGFYRAMEVVAPENSCVNAPWPVSVTGFFMPFDKIVMAVVGLWSKIVPERAMACTFHSEYLLVGGKDAGKPGKPNFTFYDWIPGGWGGRHDRDGANLNTILTGAGLLTQPAEGQERGAPILTGVFKALVDSAGPGKWRGGVGVVKSVVARNVENTVISYASERERSIVWGLDGGLPGIPNGVTFHPADGSNSQWLGAAFSDFPVNQGDKFSRTTSGGGGFGDPLERDPQHVLNDVIDGYVSIGRAQLDYGVVVEAVDPDLCEYKVDEGATAEARSYIRAHRVQWARENPETVAQRFRDGEIEMLDVIRQHAVILDWQTGEVLTKTTAQFRQMFEARSVAHWTV
ncbi:hydantoinase B/oxoprolinase family protein [Pseudomonas sp. NPDC088444]|uniref:hydantoinase B/oxoprolinase family protein n=1 Tax=Pseudomonas sp. NPDC088444 TaxID=3364456 RepID=UPI003850D3C5